MFGLGTKKYILFKIWFLILFQVVSFAKTIEILTPVIGDELALVRGKLVPNGLEEKKLFASHRHALELKGTVKTTTIPGFREKIIQILWTNVLDANNEYVLLEPFLSKKIFLS